METRTNIVLDDDLVAKAMAKARVTTKKAAIEAALRAYVREPDWDAILAMEGSNAIADDYNPATLFDRDPMLGLQAREAHAAYRVTPRPKPAPAKSPANPVRRRK